MWNTLKYRYSNGLLVMTLLVVNALVTKNEAIGTIVVFGVLLMRKDHSIFRYMPTNPTYHFILDVLMMIVYVIILKMISNAPSEAFIPGYALISLSVNCPLKAERPSFSIYEWGFLVASFMIMGILAFVAPQYFVWVSLVIFIISARFIFN